MTEDATAQIIETPGLFTRCVNCGRFLQTAPSDKSIYCSSICMDNYSNCTVCGNYYLSQSSHSSESMKCKFFFSLNKKKKPFIKDTFFNTLIIGDPYNNNELVSDKLSRVFKIPLIISEQLRLQNTLSAEGVAENIKKLTINEKQNIYFILLLNSYDTDLLKDIVTKNSFTRIVLLDDIIAEPSGKLYQLCTECGNINSFSEPDSEGKTACIICNNRFFRKDSSINLQHRIKAFRECRKFILETLPERCVTIPFSNPKNTVNEIVNHFVYS